MDSYIAAIAFDHLAIFPQRKEYHKDMPSAAVTADTVSGIINCKDSFPDLFLDRRLGMR